MPILHPIIKFAREINDICKPLQDFNITYFSHAHIDNNHNFSGICNNPDFFQHYVNNHYFNSDIHMASDNTIGNFIIWDSIDTTGTSEKLSHEASQFGIDHTFTIVEKNKSGNDYYHFATHLPSKSINQTYLANMDLLKLFILSFKNKISQSKELNESYDLKFAIDPHAKGYQLSTPEVLEITRNKRDEFLRSLIIDNEVIAYTKVSAILDTNKINITKRETQVLVSLIRGKSARVIGETLGLSPRTIEQYIENMKNKFFVDSKADIIEKIIDKLILKLYSLD